MIKKIFKIIKKIIFSAFLLYGYNLIMAPLKLIIPINFITLGALTFLGVPSLIALIAILIIVF